VTPGNADFVEVVVVMTVSTGTTAAILLVDGRLFGRRYGEHAWLPATTEAAILGTFLFGLPYGCVALLLHFIKSRWSLLGVVLGVLAAGALFWATVGCDEGALAAIDWLGL